MKPHPDFAEIALPRQVALDGFVLTPLTMAETEEDFAAVTASAAVLEGVFGDWPAGLTLDSNRVDLAWHDREFTARRSFSWIIRDAAGVYLGCIYIFPVLARAEGQRSSCGCAPCRIATALLPGSLRC